MISYEKYMERTKQLNHSPEKRIVDYLLKEGFSGDIVFETCKEPALHLDEYLVACALKEKDDYLLKSERREIKTEQIKQKHRKKKESKLEKNSKIGVLKTIGRTFLNIGEGIILPTTAFPTAALKFFTTCKEGGEDIPSLFYNLSFIVANVMTLGMPVAWYNFYENTFRTNPEMANTCLIAHIGMNVASLGYEIIKGLARKKKKENMINLTEGESIGQFVKGQMS